MKTQLPMNVTLRIGDFTLSMTQEENNNQRLEVALIRDGNFIPSRFWGPEHRDDGDVVSYVGPEALAKIIANVQRLAEFSAYATD